MTIRSPGALMGLLLLALLSLHLDRVPVAGADDDEQDPPVEAEGEGEAEGEAEAEAEAEDTAETKQAPPARPRVHKLYVPYKDLERIFEKEGDGVFVPYARWREIWERAHRERPQNPGPPVPVALRAVQYTGRADAASLELDANFEIDVLAPGWQEIPLGFPGLGVAQAHLDGKPALLIPGKPHPRLLLRGEGRHTLRVTLQGSAPLKGDAHAISFGLPAVPLARLALTVPGKDAEVHVQPRLASTTHVDSDGHTQVLAFLGPVDKLTLQWRRRPDAAPTTRALIFAQERLHTVVDRGALRTRFRADLALHRGTLEDCRILMPDDAVVVKVEAKHLRSWLRVTEDLPAGRHALDLLFRGPQKERVELAIDIETASPAPPTRVTLPWMAVDGVERERGHLRLDAAEGVHLELLPAAGLVQVDAGDLPDRMRRGVVAGRTTAYRFPARPAPASLQVRALEPRVSAAVGHRLALRPEGIEFRTRMALTVERAGIFGVRVPLPRDVEITEVSVEHIALDDWRLRDSAGGTRHLHVAFRDRLLGSAVLHLRGRMRRTVPEEAGSSVQVPCPLLLPEGAAHMRGFVLIQADAALERRVERRKGLSVLDRAMAPPAQLDAFQGERARLPEAYRFEHRSDAPELVLSLERKAPTITCQVEADIQIDPDRTRLGLTLRYDVQFRGVDTFRFSAPARFADRIHVKSPGMHLMGPDRDPSDSSGDTGIWTVKLVTPRTGAIVVPLTIDDDPEEELERGGTRAFVLPRVTPLEVEGKPLPNVTSFAAIRRDPLLEVDVARSERAEEIDIRELPPALRTGRAFLALRSYAPDYDTALRVTKHDYEPVAHVVVSHMHLDTVVPLKGRATTEAYLIVRNNDRQYLELRLPGKASIRALRVAGAAQSPRVGESGTVLIPLLAGLGKDEAFEVALVYEHDVARSGSVFRRTALDSPVPVDTERDLLTWHVFLPDDDPITARGGTVEARTPYRAWATRWLASFGKRLTQREQGHPTSWSRLLKRFESPFGTAKTPRVERFQGRVGEGSVSITRASAGVLAFLKLLAMAVGLLGVVLVHSLVPASPLVRWLLVGALALLVLQLLLGAGPGWGPMWSAVLLGMALGAAGSVLALLVRARGRELPVAQLVDEASAESLGLDATAEEGA